MKRCQFSTAPKMGILRQVDRERTVKDFCYKHNIIEAAFSAQWKKFGGMELSEAWKR